MERAVAETVAAEPTAVVTRSGHTAPGRRTALLAVGRADLRWALRQQLAAQGFTVFATGDALVALNWIATRSADVVIADVLLPGTRTAIPHVLRRRDRAHLRCPKMIGLTEEPGQSEELARLLGYDLVLKDRTPTAVITKAALRLAG